MADDTMAFGLADMALKGVVGGFPRTQVAEVVSILLVDDSKSTLKFNVRRNSSFALILLFLTEAGGALCLFLIRDVFLSARWRESGIENRTDPAK